MSKTYWVVMRACRFEDIELVGDLPAKLGAPTNEPYRYLPLFESRQAAEEFAGSPALVREVQEYEPAKDNGDGHKEEQ